VHFNNNRDNDDKHSSEEKEVPAAVEGLSLIEHGDEASVDAYEILMAIGFILILTMTTVTTTMMMNTATGAI